MIHKRKLNMDFDATPSVGHQFNLKIAKKYIYHKDILDIGCWSGQFEKLAFKYTKRIIGIDPNKQAVKFAQKNVPQAKFMSGNVLSLNFSDSSFDTVLLLDVIEHLPVGSEPLALQEIARVLKQKGHVIISTPNSHFLSILLDPAYFILGHRHYSLDSLKDILKTSGFSTIQTIQSAGILRLVSTNIELLFKVLLNRQPSFPKWLKQKIHKEVFRKGFASNYVIAQKI